MSIKEAKKIIARIIRKIRPLHNYETLVIKDALMNNKGQMWVAVAEISTLLEVREDEIFDLL